jgi:hypothetical protein
MNAATRNAWPLEGTELPYLRSRPTWEQWCAVQAQQSANHQCPRLPFSDRELAHLAFLRWLHQTRYALS